MAYVALYRKYRSQSFAELIGQDHVTTVLRNAIRSGRLGHAYLFCGPRGCGKTTTARLLARALNCMAAPGPTPDPCGECPSCTRIREGTAIDVIEMDAASETGIDDVREKIIENARYAPAESRKKIYIIDEVHDLSLKAFDSLLKTIEEPPSHVIFVLATTEAHKVPITIRSRCQRLDFRRGTLPDLVRNLERVVTAEQIECTPEALAAIAQAGEGSFRDSLSILEQVLAFSDGGLDLEVVHRAIGSVGPETMYELLDAVASDDLHAVFVKAGELVETGKDVRQILSALQGTLRDMLVARIAAGPEALPSCSPERFALLRDQASRFRPDQLLAMLDVLGAAERDLRFTNQHRLLLERALWSLAPSALDAGHAPAPARAAQPAVRQSQPATAPPGAPNPEPPPARPAPPPAPVVQPSAPDAAPARPSAPEAAPSGPVPGDVTIAVIRRAWPRVRERLKQASRAAAAIFGEETVADFDGRTITISFQNAFQLSRADRPAGRQVLEQSICDELRVQGLKVRCVEAGAAASEAAPAGPPTQLTLSDPVQENAPSKPAGWLVDLVVEHLDGKPLD